MNLLRCFVAVLIPLLLLALVIVGLAQPPNPYAPSSPIKPSEEILKKIEERKDKLTRNLQQLRRLGLHDPNLSDIEVYLKAANWISRHNEFYQREAGDWTLEALERGLLRASQQAQGEAPWYFKPGVAVVRGYRSIIDDSVQPYAVTYPEDFGKEAKKWRVEVVLHGRDRNLTEVSFLHQHNGDKTAPKDQDFIRLDVYGRGNVGYRWAGETDLTEVVNNFFLVEKRLNREQLLDEKRGVLRGFSMGGAGTWHIGLHHPDHWCVLSPGAGFTTTHGYLKDIPEKLAPHQEACLHIYDAADYAENVFDVPVVAYAGADDPQLQAARTMEERLKPLDISMKLLVAPKLGHTFPPEWQKKAASAREEHLAKGRPEFPPRVRFVTYTMKYPSGYWVEIGGLNRHYERASVDARRTEDGFEVKSNNVRLLRLTMWPGATRQPITVQIDGQKVEATPYLPTANANALYVYLRRQGEHWQNVLLERITVDRLRKTQKISGLQGPIDDAFMTPFLCVRGTGKPWHPVIDEYAGASLERFRQEWSKYLRGELQVKDDVEVTPEDIATRHLILFGDPSSNSLIAQIADALPLTWTKDKITLEGKEYDSSNHVPVLIYPSPLSATHYIVLNSGHTFHTADFQGSNALLYPRLGDYAILKLTAEKKGEKKDPLASEVQNAGLFNEFWGLSAGK